MVAPASGSTLSVPLDVTILNLPGGIPSAELDSLRCAGTSIHTFHYVEGDACNVHQFPDRSFDIAFSNSVIEHVGPEEKQEEFSREVVRLGKSYWVQTPSAWFPIEAHTGMPLYWLLSRTAPRMAVAKIAEEASDLVDGVHRRYPGPLATQNGRTVPECPDTC